MTSNASKASTRLRWLGLSALVALGVTLVEYGLNTLFSPLVDWSPSGVAAHMALDLAVLLPLAALAIWAGSGLARRLVGIIGPPTEDGAVRACRTAVVRASRNGNHIGQSGNVDRVESGVVVSNAQLSIGVAPPTAQRARVVQRASEVGAGNNAFAA